MKLKENMVLCNIGTNMKLKENMVLCVSNSRVVPFMYPWPDHVFFLSQFYQNRSEQVDIRKICLIKYAMQWQTCDIPVLAAMCEVQALFPSLS